MERPAIDQAIDLLLKEKEILLIVPEKASADAFCSMVGLSLAMEKLGKKVYMVSPSHVPQSLQFLPGTSQVHDFIETTRDLVISFPLNGVRPANVTWKQIEDTFQLVITPEKGKKYAEITPVVHSGIYPWKLVIAIGSPDLNSLGAPFADHAPFFYETPIINLDRGTSNEFYGAVNLVPVTAGTIAEVTFDLIDTLGGVNIITAEAATCLFAAILAGTHSFQSPSTTPKTFAVASQLLEQDADRQTVTRNLFKTHSLPELRLLGRGLARLKELSKGFFWSTVLKKDFDESGATGDDVPSVLQEMVERAGEHTGIILAFERNLGTIETLIYPGKISTDDRERIRKATNGTITGHFILATLGQSPVNKIENSLKEVILPQLPKLEN